jgi:hypothetical protein
MSSNENEDFEPLVVLQLAPTTPAATKEWIIKRLTASHTDDEGACLLARFEPDPENQVIVFFFVILYKLSLLIYRIISL